MQEMFDAVAIALRKQGVPSLANNMPAYRAPDGRRCAIGHLIPERQYRREYEGIRVTENYHNPIGQLLASLYGQESLPLFIALQHAHDRVWIRAGFAAWLRAMERIAGRFGLSAQALHTTVDR